MEGKTITLYDYRNFVTLHVTPKLTDQELQNVNLGRHAPLPQVRLPVLGLKTQLRLGTSFVYVDPLLYCIACPPLHLEPSDVVKTFNPSAPELKIDYSLPKMVQARLFPAVTAIGGVIYVFGGGRRGIYKGDFIWAECLDTNQPKDYQKWESLPEPPISLAYSTLYAFPFRDNQIFIFGHNSIEDSLLYDVNERSWTVLDRACTELPHMKEPVFVESHNALYWFLGSYLYAFDLDSKTSSCGEVCNSVLYDMRNFGLGLEDDGTGRVLMHLEDDVFCVFTIHCRWEGQGQSCQAYQILECTKFRVIKSFMSLHISVVGYKSYLYDCPGMIRLFDGVSISSSMDGSMEPLKKKQKKYSEDD